MRRSTRLAVTTIVLLAIGAASASAIVFQRSELEGFGRQVKTGTDGRDELYGRSSSDFLRGGGGNDYLSGGSGNDRLEGGEGDDVLLGGDGDDRLLGGPGDDLLLEEAPVSMSLPDYARGLGRITEEEGDQIRATIRAAAARGVYPDGVLDPFKSGGDDILLDGGPGDDIIFGGRGTEQQILGGEGDDIIATGPGTERDIDCGPGNDVLYTNLRSKARRARNCETIIMIPSLPSRSCARPGSERRETLLAGRRADTCRGNGGDDQLEGSPQGDMLFGGEGEDRIFGRGGNDRLFGGPGDDELQGGRGDDFLDGGGGDDLLVGGFGRNTYQGGPGNDTIEAAGNGPDGMIDCGPGFDTAFVDGRDRTRNCERVYVIRGTRAVRRGG